VLMYNYSAIMSNICMQLLVSSYCNIDSLRAMNTNNGNIKNT